VAARGWIAPRDGVLNIWVAPAANPKAAKPLTNERQRPIRSYFWAPDSKQILFINDKGGDENFLLYGVDVVDRRAAHADPVREDPVQIVGISPLVKDRILIGVNNRDPKWHDVHSLDLATGKLTPVMMNTGGYAGFIADATSSSASPPSRARRRQPTSTGRRTTRSTRSRSSTVALEDAQTTSPAGFTTDGKTLYWIDSRGRDTAALSRRTSPPARRRVIAQDAKADIGGALSNPRPASVEAYAVNYLKNEWTPLGNA
jgi:hypothetical protein